MRPRDACLPLLLVSFFAPLMAQVPKNNLDVQHPRAVGSGSRELHLFPGDAQWYSGRVTHTIENLDTRDVQFITVEFK